MGKLHKKVIRILRESFRDLEDDLEDVPTTGCVLGTVISPAFDRLDCKKRQERLKKVLTKKLTEAEYAKVGPIAALTPRETNEDALSWLPE
ncbi:MAG: hypothetical protein HY721_12975 [Planctomycetes bacterium]|nr:hypothetical protein [Planctomycetota bacterium]